MSRSRPWRGASRRLIVSFVLVLLVPAAAVVWLGARLIDQDRAVASRQLRERRESAAERVIAGLEQALSSTERRLAGGAVDTLIRPDDDAVRVTLAANAIEVVPANRLLYVPSLPPASAEPIDAFEAGEALEFRAKDYRGAAIAFRALARSPSAAVHAGALLRLARIERKLNHADNALAAYADLARQSDGRVSGLPADLVARRARCVLLEQIGRTTDLRDEARSLQADLLAARWPIDRGTFAAYSDQVAGWLGVAPALPTDREALSAASEWIWQQWTDANRREFQTAGRRARRFGAVSVGILWQPIGDRLVVLLAGPRFQQREWFQAPQSVLDARGLRVALADDDGQAVVGTVPTADAPAVERRAAAVTRLPWTVFVGSADNNADLDEIAGRRRLLFAGLVLLVGLVVAGGYFIVRAVSREFAVAQLQSDFVAAVSHEFRTPLTSLRQFTDLLHDHPDLPAAKRHTFYQAQARATERLRRLVESLLDFGRMEAGARPYRLERQRITPLVTAIVDDFRGAMPDGFTIEAALDTGGAEFDVDPDAFTRAVWNLLDNAVKYSGSSRVVRVNATAAHGAATISVQDGGLGIPRDEHEQIFKKFVRGASSRVHGIKGTGIGLAMVRHIVDAHGGTVSVDSTAGHGSTFTIAMPTAELQDRRMAGLQDSLTNSAILPSCNPAMEE